MSFDLTALFSDVALERHRRGLTWSELSGEVGVSATTIRRLDTAKDAEADGVLALVRWLRAAPEDYVRTARLAGERLAEPGVGFVRVDMARVAEVLGDGTGGKGRSRTTIQRLVEVAERSGSSVASLTRLSPL